MLNADWVQLNCRCAKVKVTTQKFDYLEGVCVPGQIVTELIETNQISWHPDYTVKKLPFRTSLAASVYEVYYNVTRIAEVITDVDSKVLDAMTVFVRFDNKFLYGKNLYERVNKFLNENGLIFHNWTRFDVACDFNYLLNGWGKKEMNPHDLIKRFIGGGIKLFNRRKGKKRKAGLYFECGEDEIDFQTLYLGSPLSPVRTKMYNKSRELKDKEDKPYIREQWELNGLINSDDVNVWRVEFQIMDFQNVAVENDVLLFSLKTLDILQDKNIELLWNCLREHYFVFYKPDGKKNVSRQKMLRLFDYEDTGIKLVEMTTKQNTTRADKIFVKKMLETQQQIRKYNELKNVGWASDYISAWVVQRHDLIDWAKKRFPNWQPENYLEPPAVEVPVVQFTINGFGTDSQTMKAEKHRYSFEIE